MFLNNWPANLRKLSNQSRCPGSGRHLLMGTRRHFGITTARGVVFKEIDELIGSRHDIHYVATGTQEEITVHRAVEVNDSGRADDCSATESTPCSSDKVTAKRSRRKRKADDTDFEDVLKFMKESEDRLVAVEEKLLAEVQEFGTSMKDLLRKLIDKL